MTDDAPVSKHLLSTQPYCASRTEVICAFYVIYCGQIGDHFLYLVDISILL